MKKNKLIDEKLKEIFKDSNITGFIEAYCYLKNTGCYDDLACMANALNFFPQNNVNDYSFICLKINPQDNYDIILYKLAEDSPFYEYAKSCILDNIIQEELMTASIEVSNVKSCDLTYIGNGYKGCMLSVDVDNIDKTTARNIQHLYVDGQAAQGGMMVDIGINDMAIEERYEPEPDRPRATRAMPDRDEVARPTTANDNSGEFRNRLARIVGLQIEEQTEGDFELGEGEEEAIGEETILVEDEQGDVIGYSRDEMTRFLRRQAEEQIERARERDGRAQVVRPYEDQIVYLQNRVNEYQQAVNDVDNGGVINNDAAWTMMAPIDAPTRNEYIEDTGLGLESEALDGIPIPSTENIGRVSSRFIDRIRGIRR